LISYQNSLFFSLACDKVCVAHDNVLNKININKKNRKKFSKFLITIKGII